MSRFAKAAIAGLAIAGVGAALIPTSAHAQATTVPVQKNYRIKLGAGFATKGGSDTVFSAGLDYDFSKSTADKPLIFSGYVDYFTKSGTSLYGVGPSVRYSLGNTLAKGQPYVGLGLGYYGISGGGSGSGFGGKVLGGYQFNEGLFGEVDYTTVSSNKIDADIIGVRVGYRF